jgi:hypothetical protein
LRQVVVSSLTDDEDMPDRYAGRHLYVATGAHAGRQTKVLSVGTHGQYGLLRVARPFTTALTSGITVELSASLPAEPYGDWDGLNPIIDDALAACWVRDRLSFTGDGANAVALTGYEWLTSPDQVIGVLDTIGSSTGNPIAAGTTWRIRSNGNTRTLENDIAYSTGTAYELDVYRPAHTLIKGASTGIWGAGDGLTADGDAAAVPVYIVGTIGLAMAYQRLLARAQWDEQLAPSIPMFERGYRRWGRAAERLKWEDLPHEAEPPTLVSGGRGGYAWGSKGIWP